MAEIPSFLKDLQTSVNKSQGQNGTSEFKCPIEIVNMRSFANHGTIYIAPIKGNNGDSVTIIPRTGWVKKRICGTKKDGTPFDFEKKLKVCLTDRLYGELTDEQKAQLDRINSKIITLKSAKCKNVGINECTLIQGMVLKHTLKAKNDEIKFCHVPALYSFESQNFTTTFNQAIKEVSDLQGSTAWVLPATDSTLIKKRILQITYFLVKDATNYTVSIKFPKIDEDYKGLCGSETEYDVVAMSGEDKILDKLPNPIKAFYGVNNDDSLWVQDNMDEVEGALNEILNYRGEVAPQVSVQSTPIKPNSNESWKVDNSGDKTNDSNSNGELNAKEIISKVKDAVNNGVVKTEPFVPPFGGGSEDNTNMPF